MNRRCRTAFASAALVLMTAGLVRAAGNGLKGEYFNNSGLLGTPTLVRTDAQVNFDWNDGSPGPGISTNRFSIRWTGQVETAAAGAYRFSTISDAGIRLWVNNALVISHWNSHSTERDNSAPVMLAAGQKYNIRLDYYENTGNATARLLWTPPGQSETAIPPANLYSTQVTGVSPVPVYVSSLDPTFQQNGWGPYQRDRSNGETGGGDGHTLGVGGVKFAKGLGVHARSELRYNLARKYKSFSAFIGIDDEVGNRGSVVFQVWLDGMQAFESPVLRGTNDPKFVEVATADKSELRLIVLDGGDGIGYDHADWADARLFTAAAGGGGTPTPPPAPTNLTAAPGNGQVMLSWHAAAGATSYNVFRGTAAGAEGSTPVMTGIGATQFTNTGLTNGTTYFFKVVAVNSAGPGPVSNEASATPVAAAPPIPAPTGLTATPGNGQVTLSWSAVAGAASYNVYRGTSSNGEAAAPAATGITGTAFTNTGLTNGTKYFFKVRAVNGPATSDPSNEASATPVAPPAPPAPTALTATAGNAQVTLAWTASPGATTYNVYRGTSAGGESATPVATGITETAFTNTGLTNNTKYFFKVAAVNANGTSDKSNEATATPVPPPPPAAPAGLSAAAGDSSVTLSWNTVAGAVTYNVYRGTKTNAEGTTPIATGITAVTFTDTALSNGTTYFYMVASVNANGTGPKSTEASATPTAPGLQLTQAQKDAFRFLRQATWGPNLALVDHVVQVGKAAFIAEQIAAPPSDYPQTLEDTPNMELVSERFFQNAIQGQDQLRQRVAWALSQIFVVSAQKVDNTHAMVPYIKMLHARAFGNLKDVMHDMALSPAMGEFLDMVNNKKAANGILPNENFAREWLQLFSIGLVMLNPDGTAMTNGGVPVPTYTQNDILEFARVLTGWTYGDTKTANPTRLNPAFYGGPMKPVDAFHDTGMKIVMGTTFNAGQTAQQDFDQALSMVFNHPNVGPFLCRQLIQRLVSSNPSPAYLSDVVGVFNDNGSGVRGDLQAVVTRILTHPEASLSAPNQSKFSEPALFLLTLSRALNASVVDHPFLSDYSQEMAQQIWFAPSVFNYFSPNFRSGAIFAPEMQIWTTATAMSRSNFVASLVSGGFGSDVTLDLTPFTAKAADPPALVDTVNALIMGGTMSQQMKDSIVTALRATTSSSERVRTAIYLAAVSMQYQVEH
jgi:uncharacterized protein (DUF1800 family)/fibronectin type 3 domain-containing protein